ncbi:hypothetical protein PT974_02413 [Cladobotryum mycophilum]|uniref:Uncharacterized protein n=1 Tax=Cladobotryum mycophilum TaxID=491253 RepID=A0ABR0SY29_9HYPO
MPTAFRFQHLPPEIRNAIYKEYFYVPNGYTFNFATRKVEAVGDNGERLPICQQLRFTCKQIARETDGMALACNFIGFSTEYSDEMRVKAARFGSCRSLLFDLADIWLQVSFGEEPQRQNILTEVIEREVVLKYPKAVPLLRATVEDNDEWGEDEGWQDGEDEDEDDRDDTWGLVPSYRRRATFHAIDLAVQHDLIPANVKSLNCHSPEKTVLMDKLYPPWHCHPTDEDLDRLVGPVRMRFDQMAEYWERPHVNEIGERQHNQGKYRFSATSLAIKFLSLFPEHLRTHIRRIRLREDAVSVSNPECHAQGLIPFCIENPLLRVERRLDLWGNVFQSVYANNKESSSSPEKMWLRNKDRPEGSGLWSLPLTNRVALWVMEAMALTESGMPRGSFKLILDAGPAPKECSEIFRKVIQRDAAWQTMWGMVVDDTNPQLSLYWRKNCHCYLYDGFPQAITDIVSGTSDMIKCTFEPGPQKWDAMEEFQSYRFLNFDKLDMLRSDQAVFIKMPPSTPSWANRLAENILPEFFETNEEELEFMIDPETRHFLGVPGQDDETTEDHDDEWEGAEEEESDEEEELYEQGDEFYEEAEESDEEEKL